MTLLNANLALTPGTADLLVEVLEEQEKQGDKDNPEKFGALQAFLTEVRSVRLGAWPQGERPEAVETMGRTIPDVVPEREAANLDHESPNAATETEHAHEKSQQTAHSKAQAKEKASKADEAEEPKHPAKSKAHSERPHAKH